VQEAFAGPDLESEFQATKRQAVDKELEIDEKKKNIIQDGMQRFRCHDKI
jgi:hypothetical protein